MCHNGPGHSLDAGKKVSERILDCLSFKDIHFSLKKATANYYAPAKEYEIYSGKIEIADCGMYSPVALANYGIEYPVFNIGFGLERILMVKKGITDIREVLYPQFYKNTSFTDRELTEQIRIERMPMTPEGAALAENIAKTARENAKKQSPCEYIAYTGTVMGKNITVSVFEKEEGTKLLGPAALNNIYAYNGGLYGLPDDISTLKKDMTEVKEKGEKAPLNFLDALSNRFASDIENALREDKKEGILTVKMAKTPGEINITVTEAARRFIESKNQPIALKGPVFISVKYKSK